MHQPLAPEFRARANCGIGAVVDLQGRASHQILLDAITILERLDHRGARGAEENTGDGAGVMLQKPDGFFRRRIEGLPPPDQYGVGQLFLPREIAERDAICARIEQVIAAEGCRLLGWREVPTDSAGLGRGALETEPCVRQLFVAHGSLAGAALDRRLFILRLALERAIEGLPGGGQFYVCSLDRRRLVYKGLLTNAQLRGYYPDLSEPELTTALAVVHSRFSTNTLGSWPLAHPHRVVVHNGEINTYRGNFNRLRAREADLAHPELGADLERLRPLVRAGVSDTALLDAALELLLAGGRSLPHALRMLIPAAWQKDPELAPAQRDWYDYHSTVMEPWDGPALVVATDGDLLAAVLDRNGFRPCRYDLTRDGRMILASEVGVLDLPASEITHRGRLGPGQMLLIDPEAGGFQNAADIFRRLGAVRYGRWLRHDRLKLDDFAPPRSAERGEPLADLTARQGAAGYTFEHLERLLRPMSEDGKDPVGAMGDDAPPATVSASQRGLFDFFKQSFAQVSNPPIDYLREDLVTSLETHIGPQPNLLAESARHCRRVHLRSPVLANGELAALRGLARRGFASRTLDLSFELDEPLPAALDRLCVEAEMAATGGDAVLVLSDRGAGPGRLALPSLLALGAVHQRLIRGALRLHTALVLEVADACSVHHLCTLIGFGADAVNPWLALASVRALSGADAGSIGRYLHALEDGLLKVMSKMGISTLESYKGGQLFEALGLAPEVVSRCFTGSVSRIGGAGFDRLEADLRGRHEAAYRPVLPGNPLLSAAGSFYWRRDGEHHDWNPETLGLLQAAVRTDDERLYRSFSALVDAPSGGPTNLRGLLSLVAAATPVPLAEVEPIESITRRFFSGAMSLGALSPEAHETLAIGMNRVGGVAHSGEGGEPEERVGTERECKNKQVASGRFGVTAAYLAAARQIEIKMAQGAKPGEGGQLPAHKVDEMIARLRHTTPGVGLISPPPHHDIYSIEDLAQLIHDLRCANPEAQIHVKLVAEAGVGTIAAGVVKAGADTVLIAGDSGGTGAATKTSIKSAGVPWELGLAEAQRVLVENRLRSRVTLRTDGGLKTGRDVIVAALLGAEEYGFGMAALVTLGCIMLRKCHCNTCSVGIATQDPELRKRFPGKPEHVVRYLRFVAAEVREHMALLGARSLDELIGRVDLLRRVPGGEPRLDALDLGVLLAAPKPLDAPRRTRFDLPRASDRADAALIEAARPALEHQKPVLIRGRVGNSDRSVGTRLSYQLTRRYGSTGLADGSIRVQLAGSAGQSLGAFLNRGIELSVSGAANDYVGKGLCGGRIVLRAPEDAGYDPASSSMAGNAVLYGATAGELYCHGQAGERFAVRNSGACAVVEGVGDHGCEYMTGGAVLVLGRSGRNFAAGMSGGEAYLLTDDPAWRLRLNNKELLIEPLTEARDLALVERLLRNHRRHTGSARAVELLADWPAAAARLVKLTPKRYAKVLAARLAAGEDLRTPLPALAQPRPALVEA